MQRKMARLTVMVILALALGLVSQAWAFSYSQFTATELADFQLNGTAATLNPNGDKVLRLTSDLTGQTSSAFLENTVALPANYAFDTTFGFKLVGGVHGYADGITFTMQKDSRGALAMGGGGGSIGYGATTPITPSVTVEFDDYVNTGQDPAYRHVAIMKNGAHTVHLANVQESNMGIYTGQWTAWIDYDGSAMHVFYAQGTTKPGTPQLSYGIDLAQILGSTNVYVGFTGSTGGDTDRAEVLNWEFNAAPLPGAVWLFGPALVGLAAWRRRRSQR